MAIQGLVLCVSLLALAAVVCEETNTADLEWRPQWIQFPCDG